MLGCRHETPLMGWSFGETPCAPAKHQIFIRDAVLTAEWRHCQSAQEVRDGGACGPLPAVSLRMPLRSDCPGEKAAPSLTAGQQKGRVLRCVPSL